MQIIDTQFFFSSSSLRSKTVSITLFSHSAESLGTVPEQGKKKSGCLAVHIKSLLSGVDEEVQDRLSVTSY